ncbi:cytochrome c [Phenylobacterium sp. J426]|uniref:c-type cytochrome n=1 Tax=Phenylobacterium sp. J426 TaxID=2898439 RepID=UPI002151C51F|nr:cytochrome c [Phenylobacterium sp. J426]MCR5876440.1 cytochrome c [Phenylobacterium sp. J426]
MRLIVLAVAALLAGGAQVSAAETPRVMKPAVLRGRLYVQNHCVGCHNARADGRSVYSAAPPLRDLAGRYTPAQLQTVLADVQVGNHFAMPSTPVTSRDALDIAAYIEALARADKDTQRKLSLPACVARAC